MRCNGSSFACAAFGWERAGLVNHECMGAVIGPPPIRTTGVFAAPSPSPSPPPTVTLAFGLGGFSAGERRELGVSGMGRCSRSRGTCVAGKDG